MPDAPKVEGAETARRALRVLELVARAGRPIGLDELVRRAELAKSTVYRLLRVLADEGYVERVETGGYVSGTRLLSLAAAAMPDADSYARCLPLLRELADAASETATLHRRAGDHALLVLGAQSNAHSLRRVATAGESTPLVRGSSGLALLSALPTTVVDELLDGMASDDTRRVRRALTGAHTRGYVLSFGSNHPGINGIAAPVSDRPLSIALSGPEARWTRDRMTAFAPHLLAAVKRVAALLF